MNKKAKKAAKSAKKKTAAKAVKKPLSAKSVAASKAPDSFFHDMEKRMMEMEKRFESIFPGRWFQMPRWEMPEWPAIPSMDMKVPSVDIVDREKDILVRADIPGVKKKNLDVSLTDNTITIKGSTSEEKKEEEGDYFRSETIKGSFTRTVSLPSDVNGSKARSTFKHGVLEVVVPKLGKAHRRSVKVE